MSENLLGLRGVKKSFTLGGEEVKVLVGLDFDFAAGVSVTIQGASGTGKSTLLHLLGGLDSPDQGHVTWNGEAIASWSRTRISTWRRDEVGIVFQSYQLLPELSAIENVELPARITGRSRLDQARELLRRVGMEHRAGHRPAELSGGEQQRVAIARALLNEPRLILADEPTGNLDRTTGGLVMDLLFEICRERGATLILVTHDALVAARGERRLLLSNGTLQDSVS